MRHRVFLAILALGFVQTGCPESDEEDDNSPTDQSSQDGKSGDDTGSDNDDDSGNAGETVTFVIKVDPAMFAADAVITVRVFDAAQMAIMDETNDCSVSANAATGEEVISCPDGVEYKEATPEEFTFNASEIDGSIEVASTTVSIGEAYRILASGTASDNCNTTSTSHEGQADSATVNLTQLAWGTTEMACL